MKHLAASFPDIPRWIELRSLLLRGECDVTGLEEGSELSIVVRDCMTGLVCVAGTPGRDAIRAAVAQSTASNVEEVLAPPECADHILSALPTWRVERATLHLLADSSRLPRLVPAGRTGTIQRPFIDPEAMPVPADALEEDIEMRYLSMAEVDALPFTGEERQEYLTAALHTQVAATFVEGQPVSFCYAGATTESLWDMSLETLVAYQNRGYAALCAAFTIDQMHRERKNPVWGALHSNTPSLRLASKLGFREVDEILVFTPG